MFVENIQINTLGQFLSFVLPTSRVYWLYLVTAFILAFIAYHQFNHEHDEEGNDVPSKNKSFLQYVFDKEVWFHPSTWQDCKFFLVNAVVYYGIASQFLLGTHGFSILFNNMLTESFGALSAPAITNEASLLIYTILSVIAFDLGIYLSHRAQHNIPFLWEFHKVHHSAEQLTPITLFRMHPVDLFITALTASFLGGMAYAGLFYLTGEEPQAMTLFGLNVITFFFYIIGYNLRHSHVWLNYPYWLSKIFISPAQHQIHHSTDPKHFDRNFGLIFSFWDQIGNSHYIPRGFEKLSFGLDKKEPNPFKTIGDIYFKPFIWSWKIASEALGSTARKTIAVLCMAIGIMTYIQINNYANLQIALSKLPSVKIADLTWTEIDKAMREGYDSIIIPTGGIEQNGPHVVLGKHNIVITHTSTELARKLGNTLVTPVVDHVPEGSIEPVTDGHMTYAGTISVPQNVFESILEATARSMKAHGFKKIFFIGDSLGNQDGQASVAKRLSEEWRNDGILVAHIGDYYSSNGQFSYLQNAGYTDQEIGWHAGMRDTSELLYIDPTAVRQTYINWPDGRDSGASGSASKASASIGKQMLQLKIDAAFEQISQLLKSFKPKNNNEAIASVQ